MKRVWGKRKRDETAVIDEATTCRRSFIFLMIRVSGDAGSILFFLFSFFIKMFEEAERFSKTFYNESRYREYWKYSSMKFEITSFKWNKKTLFNIIIIAWYCSHQIAENNQRETGMIYTYFWLKLYEIVVRI